MGEWEKRKGERGGGERLINRGSVELRGGGQILGEGIERKGRVERKTGGKKKNQEIKKKRRERKPNTNHYHLRFESNPEARKEQFGPSEGRNLF